MVTISFSFATNYSDRTSVELSLKESWIKYCHSLCKNTQVQFCSSASVLFGCIKTTWVDLKMPLHLKLSNKCTETKIQIRYCSKYVKSMMDQLWDRKFSISWCSMNLLNSIIKDGVWLWELAVEQLVVFQVSAMQPGSLLRRRRNMSTTDDFIVWIIMLDLVLFRQNWS